METIGLLSKLIVLTLVIVVGVVVGPIGAFGTAFYFMEIILR